MENSLYFDTNIVIDLLDSTRPIAKDSFAIMQRATMEGRSIYINSDTVTNAFYILSKQKKYTHPELIKLLKKVVNLFEVVPVEQKEVLEALTLCEDEKSAYKDYEDALQYVCAKKAGASVIVTNDKMFVSDDVPCMNSVAYMDLLER